VEEHQARLNRSTRGQWDLYAHHRRMIERLIIPEERGQKICVLGAGNCNDLDLAWMSQAYDEVRLVDIDPAALERAVERQAVKTEGSVVLQAPVDLTGIADLIGSWKGRTVSTAVVRQAIAVMEEEAPREALDSTRKPRPEILWLPTATPRESAARSPSPPDDAEDPRSDFSRTLRGQFDVVLSPCVLSQLWCGARDVLGGDHPEWPALKEAIRRRHLRQIMKLLRPGGRGVVICDLASSNRVKGLERARAEETEALMHLCIGQEKGFRGLEPADMSAAVRAVGGDHWQISRPWLWHLGVAKAFLCYGGTFRKP